MPTTFLDLVPAPAGAEPGIDDGLPGPEIIEQSLIEKALQPFLDEVQQARLKEIDTISNHMEISLNELIHRQNLRMAELLSGDQSRENNPLLAANLKQVEDKVDELNNRLERRRTEIERETLQHHCRYSASRPRLGHGTAVCSAAQECPLPNDSASMLFTDPPYFAAIPYGDLALLC